MQFLMVLEELTCDNWEIVREMDPPPYLPLLRQLNICFLSYDNHHNIVDMIKKIYHTLCCKLTGNKDKLELIKKECKL